MKLVKLLLQVHMGGFVFAIFLAALLMCLDSITTATDSVTFSFRELLFILVCTQGLMFFAFIFMWGES